MAMMFNKGQMFNSTNNNQKASTLVSKVMNDPNKLGRRTIEEIKEERMETNIGAMKAKAAYTRENIRKEEALANQRAGIKKEEKPKALGRVEVPNVSVKPNNTITPGQNSFKSFNNRGF